MSIDGLQFMVGRAVISDEYCAGILNGQKADLIRDLDLDPGESAQVLAIRANTLAEFAAEVDRIVQAQLLTTSRAANVRGLRWPM
ncbi:hypothetical protein TFLX_04458 [Thermoflexales bacterium]|nr:hypothetical protein TFLX_04458 [Thermoflexales bacterium]